jgi:hypothetical protein
MVTNFEQRYHEENVEYGYSRATQSWEFTWDETGRRVSLILKTKGKDNAGRVARIIRGSLKRAHKLDGLARANIYSIV